MLATFLCELHEMLQQWTAEEAARDVRLTGRLSANVICCQRTGSPTILRLRQMVVRFGHYLMQQSLQPWTSFEDKIKNCSLEELGTLVLRDGVMEKDYHLLYWTKLRTRKLLEKMRSGCPCQFCSPFVLANKI